MIQQPAGCQWRYSLLDMTENTETLLAQLQQAKQQLEAGDSAGATSLYTEVAQQAGDDLLVNLHLAQLCTAMGNASAAESHLQTIIAQETDDLELLVTAAKCLGEINLHDKGISLARRAVAIDPENPDALSALGSLLVEAGKTEEAQDHLLHMIEKRKNLRLAYTNLARLRKFTSEDSTLIDQAEAVIADGLPAREQLAVNFALGKIYDDCREFHKAFPHFQQANELQKEAHDHNNDLNWFKQINTVFTEGTIGRLSEGGHQSSQPVFIVGMPRSGTTLMERIIASHSQGAGAGELLAMPRIAHQIMRENEVRPAERAQRRMTPDLMAGYSNYYLQTLRLGQPPAQRIVDKLPGNYQNLGLIHALFPNASIVHAVRHPLDTCLSCYFQAFAEVRWSNDLKTIADTYKLYREYMKYWQKVLPRGKILEVQYEALVENPTEEGQRMLNHCGLSWEAESLEYHQQQAVVRTVSHAQVRQPIYQTSRKRWMNYAKHIQPLVDELTEYLKEDQAMLEENGLKLKKKKRFGLF
ncbi:MAG: sulfotransferase [Gammaproteobacteria bacterium]